MRSHREVLAGVVLATMVVLRAIGQDWTPTSAPPFNWGCLASSADGRKLIVGSSFYSQIYVSTNFGSSWTSASSPTNDWGAVACSADGSVIIASGYASPGLYVSRDSGASWALTADGYSSSVACSADGKRMVAAYYNKVLISTNSGADWVPTSAPKGGRVTMSADGSRLAIASRTASIDVSTNFGITWTPAYPTKELMYHEFVATSGDGGTLMALSAPPNLSSPALISVSSDWGATWWPVGSMTNLLGNFSAACSADGTTLAVAESPTGEYDITFLLLSTNSGAVWSTQVLGSTNLCSVVSSADGSRLAAALGHIFWPGESMYVRQTTPVPVLKALSGPGGLELSWLLPSEPFVLEESPDLRTWSHVDVTPILNYTNLHYVANLPTPIGPKFYRLASQ